MSYRQNLRPTPAADYFSPTKRQPSNASNTSTAYSNSSSGFDLSRTSTISSTTSSGYAGHKRGLSEATGMSHSSIEPNARSSYGSSPESPYKNVRQSLRPLPRTPTSSPPVKIVDRPQHSRGYSVDVPRMPLYTEENTPTPATQISSVRPNSMLLSRANTEDYTATPTARNSMRPNSMVLSRTDSMSRSSRGHTLNKFSARQNCR